ncbi:MAG: extracellular solute-binding protein [Gammaproteobacteria bacterium]|nr:extracellular solute-binding protein [Gammaproteobacteria bacterium]
MATPVIPGSAMAAATDQPTYFTWGGWDDPAYFKGYIKKYGEAPNFATYAGSEEGFTKMRAGFVVDVAHPCNVEIPRWISSGLFQPLDTSKLSNWNDLVDWKDDEQSWGLLWDERYKGRIASLDSAGDAWWVAAIYAGIDFKDIAKKESLEQVAALLRKQRSLVRMYSDDVTSLEQALASGELVAAMTWNSSVTTLKAEGVPVAFAKPKEGAQSCVCGLMIPAKAPMPDKAHELIDYLIGVERGIQMITEEGYGHSNAKAIAAVLDE